MTQYNLFTAAAPLYRPRVYFRPVSTLLLAVLMMLLLAACDRQGDSQDPVNQGAVTEAVTEDATEAVVSIEQPAAPAAESAAAANGETAAEVAALLDTPLAADQRSATSGTEASTEDSPASALAALMPTPTPEQAAAPPRVSGVVNASLVNLRRTPALDGEVVVMAEAGEVLDIIGVDATREWLAVCCVPELAEGEDSLWVSAELVDGDFAALVDAGPDAALRVANDDVERTEDVSAGGAAVVQVDADLVNVRSGPGTNYPVVATAGSADAYTLNGRSEDGTWLQVCCLGAEQVPGWISGDFVTAAGIDAAAVVAAPPLPEPASAPVAGAGQSDAARLAAAPAPGIPGAGGFGAPGGANPLTGLGLDGGRTGQRPLIVCINNDFAARPQLGISQADIMYEYLMEGYGITRFSGVFYGDEVGQIGPVRSARLINYYMGALFEAGLACSGASDGVRYTLKEEAPFPYMDIDLDDPSNARYSVSVGNDYRTRLRTSSAGLRRWLADWGVEQPAAVRGFSFGATPEGGVPATTVNIPYPRATASQVSYRYDPASGRYLRSLGDAPHLDGNSGAQVGVENVIVQYVPHETTDIVEDSLGSLSIRLNLFGSGRSIVLRDGVAYEGEWRSESRGDLPRFYAEDGREIPLKPGRTWVSVVPFDYGVSYQ